MRKSCRKSKPFVTPYENHLRQQHLDFSFLIGKRLAALRTVFSCQDINVYYCDELEQEFLDVSHRPKIQRYVDEQQIQRVHQLMTHFCHHAVASTQNATPVRDPKDVYLLALSDAVKADFLVSGDSDLTDMQQHNQTKIIDFNTALTLLVGVVS